MPPLRQLRQIRARATAVCCLQPSPLRRLEARQPRATGRALRRVAHPQCRLPDNPRRPTPTVTPDVARAGGRAAADTAITLSFTDGLRTAREDGLALPPFR